MFGTTLRDIRRYVEALASDDGRYVIACARTGERPVPIADQRFHDRTFARLAARAAAEYRRALRRYDPRLPVHDLVVTEVHDGATGHWSGADSHGPGGPDPATANDPGPVSRWRDESRTPSGADPSRSDPADIASRGSWTPSRPDRGEAASGRPDDPSGGEADRPLAGYCRGVATAVFEALSAHGHDGVETAVVDDSLLLAESGPEPDRRCVRLLESVAAVVSARLAPHEQADVLADAADRLGPDPGGADPVLDAFARLQRVGLVGEYARSPWPVDADAGRRSVVVRVSEYALSPREGRLPVLPVVVAIARSQEWSPVGIAVESTAGGWRLTVDVGRSDACGSLTPEGPGERAGPGAPDGFAAVPIRSRG